VPYNSQLSIHHAEPFSLANGPGARYVIWVQGCSLHCPGCFNPQTHALNIGDRISPSELWSNIQNSKKKIEGVTISGGEPLQQLNPVLELARIIKANSTLSIILFSGFSFTEIKKMELFPELVKNLDVLIAGRFIEEKRIASRLSGSSNKTIHFFTDKYTMKDIEAVPEAEVIIDPSGEIVISGINPLKG
jgi:anaerobic ribonucleoside-triphosphate reductase activating protein